MISKRNGFTSLIISYSHRISSSLCFNGLLSSNSFVWRISSASIDLQTSQRLDQIADQIADLMNNQNPSYPKTTKTSHSFVHSLNSKLILFFFLKKASLLQIPYPSISLILTHIKPEFDFALFTFSYFFHVWLWLLYHVRTIVPCLAFDPSSRVRSFRCFILLFFLHGWGLSPALRQFLCKCLIETLTCEWKVWSELVWTRGESQTHLSQN